MPAYITTILILLGSITLVVALLMFIHKRDNKKEKNITEVN
jgi:heme/copper-type cytochrome/quinol oxidase subunit 4